MSHQMLHLQAGGRGILYTDHVNGHVCSKFHEKVKNARTRTCKPEIQWLIWRGGTGETYQTGKLPEPDRCMVKQVIGVGSGVSGWISTTLSFAACKSCTSGSGMTTTFSMFTRWGIVSPVAVCFRVSISGRWMDGLLLSMARQNCVRNVWQYLLYVMGSCACRPLSHEVCRDDGP